MPLVRGDGHLGSSHEKSRTLGYFPAVFAAGGGSWLFSRPDRGNTGVVSTRFRWMGLSDKIVVDGFDEPQVEGVACHISLAQTGGV